MTLSNFVLVVEAHGAYAGGQFGLADVSSLDSNVRGDVLPGLGSSIMFLSPEFGSASISPHFEHF